MKPKETAKPKLFNRDTLLKLNLVTIWAPMAFILSVAFYIPLRTHSSDMTTGMNVAAAVLLLSPFLVVGVFAAIASLVWQVNMVIRKPGVLSRKTVILGALWALASVAYLALWVYGIVKIFGGL